METSSLPLICPLLLIIFRILGDSGCQSPSGLQRQEYGEITCVHLQHDNKAAKHSLVSHNTCLRTRATDVELLSTEVNVCHGFPSLNRYSSFKNYPAYSYSWTTVSLVELLTSLQFNDDVDVDGCRIGSLDYNNICGNTFATSDASPKESLLPNWLLVSVVAIIFLVSFFGCASCSKETTNDEEDKVVRDDIDGKPTDTHDIEVGVISDDHHNGYEAETPGSKTDESATSNADGGVELDVHEVKVRYETDDETSKRQSGDQKSNRISDRFMSMYVRKEEAIRQDSINDTVQQTTPDTPQRDFNLLADPETSTTQQLTNDTEVNQRESISDKIFDLEIADDSELGAKQNTGDTGDFMSKFIEQDTEIELHAEHSTSTRLDQPTRRISDEISPTLIAGEFGSDHIDHTDIDIQSANDRDYDYKHDKPQKDHESYSSSEEDEPDFAIK